ncbi:MAG: hypothetical protein NUW09_08485 [Deltaproteobacteria bacterium]|nr:hypothetical protein [Deltaproteobacteria bacterium]
MGGEGRQIAGRARPEPSYPEHAKKHGVETIDLGRLKENPIIGKVVFSFRRWK